MNPKAAIRHVEEEHLWDLVEQLIGTEQGVQGANLKQSGAGGKD